MKKTIALVLTLVLAFALSITAFAAPDGAVIWDDMSTQNGATAPADAAGRPVYWGNYANLRGSVADGILTLDYRPEAYDPADTDALWTSEEEYYSFAGDWAGNFGNAMDIWNTPGLQLQKYLNIVVKGAAGGEESALILNMHPDDKIWYTKFFTDLVLADGGSPKITTEWQTLTIDLEKSGFPGMTNAMHIFAYKPANISIDEIYFTEPTGTAIDTTDPSSQFPAGVDENGITLGEYLVEQFKAGNLNKPADPGPSTPTAPKTGDTSLFLIAGIALLVACAGVVTVLRLRKVKE